MNRLAPLSPRDIARTPWMSCKGEQKPGIDPVVRLGGRTIKIEKPRQEVDLHTVEPFGQRC